VVQPAEAVACGPHARAEGKGRGPVSARARPDEGRARARARSVAWRRAAAWATVAHLVTQRANAYSQTHNHTCRLQTYAHMLVAPTHPIRWAT
jgi:hypothetical protein